MVLGGNSSHKYPVKVDAPQENILDPTSFLLYNDDLDNVICNIAIYTDDTTLYLKGNQTFDLC